MDQTLEFPDRRDGLDNGSVAELADDCQHLHLPHVAPLTSEPHHVATNVAIDVPADAADLLVGLGDYGS
jgi:hypothetical protein